MHSLNTLLSLKQHPQAGETYQSLVRVYLLEVIWSVGIYKLDSLFQHRQSKRQGVVEAQQL